MLIWMTKGLAGAVLNDQRIAAANALAAAAKHPATKHSGQAPAGQQAADKPPPKPSAGR
jgi:hypothetical protein